MTLSQEIITIGMVVLGTALTRYLPFLLFPAGKPTPKYIQYLGKCFLELCLGFWSSTVCVMSVYCQKVMVYRNFWPFWQLFFSIYGNGRCFCLLQEEQFSTCF